MRSIAFFGLYMMATAGCNRSAPVVSGSVSVNGQPVSRGYVTFFPAQGTKATRGVEVKDGRYLLTVIPPGQWRVQVMETPDVEILDQNGGPPLLKMRNAKTALSSRASGNPLVVDIRRGKQTVNIAQQYP